MSIDMNLKLNPTVAAISWNVRTPNQWTKKWTVATIIPGENMETEDIQFIQQFCAECMQQACIMSNTETWIGDD